MGSYVAAMKQNSLGKVFLLGVMLGGWVIVNSAMAKTLPDANIPEALKNIRPAAGSCTAKTSNEAKPTKKTQVAVVKPDLSCAVEPREVAHLLKSSNMVLIDTRRSTDFVNFHIDGAMNLNPAEVRSKSFLRGKSVILIGNGKGERELYIDCSRLKSNGFKQARVLQGGISAWLASDLDVYGQPPNSEQLTRLTPSELLIESQFEANLILVEAGQDAVQKQIKGSIVIPDEKPETIQSAIDKHRRKLKSGAVAAVVLVVKQETDYETLSQAIKPVPLLVYSGTAEAFAQQLAQQAAVWAAQAKGPKQPSGCGR
jgi:rhodanese-related sulfurtransferase